MRNFQELVNELKDLCVKNDKFLKRTQKLNETLVEQTDTLVNSVQNIRKMLGVEPKNCPVCCERPSTHCLETCHHCFCDLCASRCLRGRKCFICRTAVTATFKIFL